MKISARVVACTRWEDSKVRTTLECVYPKFLQAELNTHGLLSRSAMSSRAVPLARVLEQVENDPYVPRRFGINSKGMQPAEYAEEGTPDYIRAKSGWLRARDAAVTAVRDLVGGVDVHKQHVNRLLEPFMWTIGVVTAEEWENFFALRLPLMPYETRVDSGYIGAMTDMSDLALEMYRALTGAAPSIQPFHVPYVDLAAELTAAVRVPSTLLGVSAMRCARVSFRPYVAGTTSYEEDAAKSRELVENGHWGPFQHPAIALGRCTSSGPNGRELPSGADWFWQRAREFGRISGTHMDNFARLRALQPHANLNNLHTQGK